MRTNISPIRNVRQRLSARLADFHSHTGGNFAVTLAICAIPLFLTGGLALDYSGAYMFRGRLQDAVDAATLAAGRDITRLNDAELKALVTDFINANLTQADLDKVDGYKIDIDRTKLAIKVTADARMPASFAPLVGIKTLDYQVMASIKASSTGIEAVLVLDNTWSMASNGKIGSLKKASRSFVDTLLELNKTDPDLVRIAIVPFADYVNVGTDYQNAPWIDVPSSKKKKWGKKTKWRGCVGSRSYPLNLKDSDFDTPVPGLNDVSCPSEITPLTDNKKVLKQQITAFEPNGYTYIPAGLSWGYRVLTSQSPFTQGLTKKEAEEKRIKKAVILMTDGENTVSKPWGSPYHNDHDRDQTNAWTAEMCEAIKADDIAVYTMTFGTAVPSKTKALIKACATSPEYYFDASNGDGLNDAFADVASSLSKLYLTE